MFATFIMSFFVYTFADRGLGSRGAGEQGGRREQETEEAAVCKSPGSGVWAGGVT